ncbi:MAG: GGDEF domain-containing protein, partial [Anaerolineales bacterium]
MKADTSRRSLLRTPVGVITTASSLGVIAYTAWIFSGSNDLQVDELVLAAGLVLLNLVVCAFGAYVVMQPDFGRTLRWAWFMLTLGTLSYTIARAVQLYSVFDLHIDPFPYLVNFSTTLRYPLTTLGLLIFPLAFVPRKERGLLWLDLAIVITFFGMVLWYFFLDSPMFSVDQGAASNSALVYSVGDFLVLAAIIALIQRDLTRVARWILGFMAFAIIFTLLGDLFSTYYEPPKLPYQIVYLNILWLCSAQFQMLATARLIASGPAMLDDPPAQFSPFRHLFSLALPYLAIIIGLALLALSIYTDPVPDQRLIGLIVGAYSLVGLVLLRQYLVLKENLRLYQTMRRIAWTDSLTGVYNRHFFNEMLPRELE